MGGSGSGNRWRWAAHSTVSDYRSLDVRRLAREGLLRPGSRFGWQWTCGEVVTGSIRIESEIDRVTLDYRTREGGDWEAMRYPVLLSTSPCHLGGLRQWFLCPARGCGRRVAKLYGGKVFACRQCHQLAYPSQREDASDRAARRAEKIRGKLGWEPGILNGGGPKPSRMHWRTFERLVEEHDEWAEASCALIMAKVLGIAGRN